MRLPATMLVSAALALGGCAASKVCTPPGLFTAGPPPPDWREAATRADHDQVRDLRALFVRGLDAARSAGFAARIDGEGHLFDPDYSQDGAALPPGRYRCARYTLGGRDAFLAVPAADCVVATPEGGLQSFGQTDGVQRPVGAIYPDTLARTFFLGTLVLPDEATALTYGRDPDRDVIGEIRRVGPSEWRMTIPYPTWDGLVAVVKLTPE